MFETLRRLLRCTRAVAAIEAGIIFPVLLTMTIGIVDLGMAMYEKMAVNAAAQAGAAYAVIHNSVSGSGFTSAMQDAAGGLTISATPAPSISGTTIKVVTVSATSTFPPFFPVSVKTPWVRSLLTFTSTVTIRVQ